MSAFKMLQAMIAHELSPSAKLVLLALASFHHDKTGVCNPSRETIAQITGLSITTVWRSLNELEGRYVNTIYDHRHASQYNLKLPKLGKKIKAFGVQNETD